MKLQYGWVVVAAGALMGCVAMGTTFSLAVFLQPMSEATGWSRTGVSTAMTLVFITMGIGGFGWGALTDRFGPKIVVLSGALLLGAGLALASRATSLFEFQLAYGLRVGGSAGPIFHTISYAIACGLAPAVAVTIYSMEGLAGLFGRLIFGVAGDKFGAKPTLVAGLLIQALAAGAYFFTRQLGEFYAVAIVFGMTYAGVRPLDAVIAREYFPMRIMGTVFGAATMVSCLGMALGPVLGGWIFDHFRSYGWLYIGSF